MLLRSILEVICETNLAKGHALREDKSGGASQIESHLGKAWRYDIDREYHLHYWKKVISSHLLQLVLIMLFQYHFNNSVA